MQSAQPEDPTLRIAIHCKRRLFRDALTNCLAGDPEFTVVGHVADTQNLIELCALSRPDVVFFDASDGLPDGLDALRALRSRFPGTEVVLAYERLAPSDLAVAVRAGVDTLIPYSHGLDALFAVLRRSLPTADRGKEALSQLDREILALVGTGHSVDRIATLLRVSKGTVESSKRRIYHKLAVSGQSQAMARVTALGLLGRAAGGADRASLPNDHMLVLLRGEGELLREYVMPALAAHGVPAIVDKPDRPHPGPGLLVLVDPAPECWPGADDPPNIMALVRTSPMPRTEVIEALDRGVSAVVEADCVQPENLVAVLTLAAQGHVVLAVPEARAMVGAVDTLRGETHRGLPDLTARECDILRSIARGHTVRQTARILGIAEKTVENIQTRLFRKLGVHNRPAALTVADALGLIDLINE